MFFGRFYGTIDQKGRVFVPSKFRDAMNGLYASQEFFLIRNLYADQCLDLYPKEEWKIIDDKIKTLPKMKAEVRAFIRTLYEDATTCQADSQGRILIPQELRTFARLNGEVALVGLSNKIELWSKEKWLESSQERSEAFPKHRDLLSEMGVNF